MTDTEIKGPEATPALPRSELKELVASASHNPALLKFPQDRWGFTSKIKTQVLDAASTVRGNDDKHELLIGTLAVLIAHIKARKAHDAEVQERRLERIRAEASERGPRERVTGRVVNNVPVDLPVE